MRLTCTPSCLPRIHALQGRFGLLLDAYWLLTCECLRSQPPATPRLSLCNLACTRTVQKPAGLPFLCAPCLPSHGARRDLLLVVTSPPTHSAGAPPPCSHAHHAPHLVGHLGQAAAVCGGAAAAVGPVAYTRPGHVQRCHHAVPGHAEQDRWVLGAHSAAEAHCPLGAASAACLVGDEAVTAAWQLLPSQVTPEAQSAHRCPAAPQCTPPLHPRACRGGAPGPLPADKRLWRKLLGHFWLRACK